MQIHASVTLCGRKNWTRVSPDDCFTFFFAIFHFRACSVPVFASDSRRSNFNFFDSHLLRSPDPSRCIHLTRAENYSVRLKLWVIQFREIATRSRRKKIENFQNGTDRDFERERNRQDSNLQKSFDEPCMRKIANVCSTFFASRQKHHDHWRGLLHE